jgi:hypothetical protein
MPYLSPETKTKIKIGKNIESTQNNLRNIENALERLGKTPTARFTKKAPHSYSNRKTRGGNGSNGTRRSKNRRA